MGYHDLHDKDVFRLCLAPILTFFLALAAIQLDLSKARFLEPEGHDQGSRPRGVVNDLVIEAPDMFGVQWVLFEEFQRYLAKNMDPRMIRSHKVVSLRWPGKSVLGLLFQLRGRPYPPGLSIGGETYGFPSLVVQELHFLRFNLRGMPTTPFLNMTHPVGGYLAALAGPSKGQDAATLKAACIVKVLGTTGVPLDLLPMEEQHLRRILYTMVETDITVPAKQQARYQKLLIEHQEVEMATKNYAAQLREQAVEEARPRIVEEARPRIVEEARPRITIEVLRSNVMSVLEARFGAQPAAAARLRRIFDAVELQDLLVRVSTAATIGDTGLF